MQNHWLVPTILILAGYAAGRIFERWIILRLRKLASRSSWRADDIVLDKLGGTPTLWFTLAGFSSAITSLPVSESIEARLNKAIIIAFIASATLLSARLAAALITEYGRPVSEPLVSTTIFTNVARAIVYITGVLIVLQTLGISVTPILTALGVGGLAVALALQDTLSNLFSGLQVIGSGQIKPGDFIRLDTGEEGYVADVSWKNTTIRELPNNMIIVPNSKLASSRVRNFYQPDRELAVLVNVGVSYSSNLENVERVTIEVASDVMRTVTGGVPEFEPFIRFHTFGDFSIDFTVIMRGREFVDQYLIKHEFVKRLHKRYKVENIEIPFPVRTVHMESSSQGDSAAIASMP